MAFDIHKIRADFPILHQQVDGKPLVYLDNAATSQKPLAVIDAVRDYYLYSNANVHRGVHVLSERATAAYENSREKIKKFINAKDVREVIFVRGTTEGINLVAHSYVANILKPADEILITTMEHHSNIVPWQLICQQKDAVLKVAPINQHGEILLDRFESLLTEKTKLVAVNHISNAIGTVNPVEKIIEMAHRKNIPVLIDGAQAAAHTRIDVQKLNCDFYIFSGHKTLAPTGIGVMYGKTHLLEQMIPYQGGGEMISRVTFEKSDYKDIPYKFEAGTPHISGAIGLATAIDYLEQVGFESIHEHEQSLLDYATAAVSDIPGIRVIGTAKEKASILSFVMDGIHAHDVGTILNSEGIAVRSGHHCAMPLMNFFNVPATSRASFSFYNTHEEIDRFINALQKAREIFK